MSDQSAPELHEYRVTRTPTAAWHSLNQGQPFTSQQDAFLAGWAARALADTHPNGADNAIIHITVGTRNLGYYRTQVDCSCGTPWWFGDHDGDPSHDAARAEHLSAAQPITATAFIEQPAPAEPTQSGDTETARA